MCTWSQSVRLMTPHNLLFLVRPKSSPRQRLNILMFNTAHWGVTTGCILPIGHSVLFEFKLRYLKNPKLFSIRVKELFEPIVLKKKGDGFALFLKAFSWEIDLWVTLGDFTVKKRKIGKGNLYLTENRLSRNEILCATDNHNYMCPVCAIGFIDLKFNKAVIDKISNFHEIAPNFTYSQKSQYLKYLWKKDKPTAPIIFMTRTYKESIPPLFFCQLWAVEAVLQSCF